MPKGIGVSDEDYELVKAARKDQPDGREGKESMIAVLHRIINEWSAGKGKGA